MARRSWSKHRLSKLLKRDAVMQPLDASHIKFLWAAYRLGGLEPIVRGLDQDQFRFAMEEIAVAADSIMVGLAQNPQREEPMPCCVVVGRLLDDFGIIPHVAWLPWATDRNKLELGAKYFSEIRDSGLVGLAYMPKPEQNYLEQLCRYGVLRRVGTIQKNEEDVALFQTRKYK